MHKNSSNTNSRKFSFCGGGGGALCEKNVLFFLNGEKNVLTGANSKIIKKNSKTTMGFLEFLASHGHPRPPPCSAGANSPMIGGFLPFENIITTVCEFS